MQKWLILFLSIICSYARAQEMWGISNSNFAGNMGIFINPSSIVGAPYKNEFNFLSADIYAQNSYIYYPAEEQVILRSIFGGLGKGKLYRNDASLSSQKAFGHLLLIGPSYINNQGDYAWGIHTALRSEASVLSAPNNLAYAFYDDFNTPDIFGIRNNYGKFSAAAATWLEIGGTFGKVLKESNERYIKWGGTVNVLLGLNSLYIDVKDLQYTVLDSNNYLFHKVEGTFAHAYSLNNNNNAFAIRGFGAGTTLGITFIRKRNPSAFDCTMKNDNQSKYKYKAGVSLIDLGMIRSSSSSRMVNISSNTDRVWFGIDSANATTLNGADYLIINNLGGSISEENFNLFLPTALSAQFDYQIQPNVFANATLVKRIHFATNQIARPDQLCLSARYERRRYEANLNLSLWEWRAPSVGVGFRYHWIVIGSDRLLQFLGLNDVKAFDFFFGIKYQFCSNPFARNKKYCPAYSELKNNGSRLSVGGRQSAVVRAETENPEPRTEDQ